MNIIIFPLIKKYPVYRQLELTDCAPAALLSILKYYHISMSAHQIRSLCRTNAQGTSLLDLKKAAETIGFRATGVTGTYAQLKLQKPPFIVHVTGRRSNHYMVIYKIADRFVLAGDPAEGLRVLSKQKFEQLWASRAALLLWPERLISDKKKRHPAHYLKAMLRQEGSLIVQNVFLGMVNTAAAIFIAIYIHFLVDVVIPSSDLQGLKLSAAVLVSLFLSGAVCMLLRQRLQIFFIYRAGTMLNRIFHKHLHNLPRKFFDTIRIGDLLVRINDLLKIPATAVIVAGSLIIDTMMILSVVGILFLLNKNIALVILLVIPVNLLAVLIFMRRISRDQHELIHRNTHMQDTYIDTIEGIDDIISYNAQNSFYKKNLDVFKNMQKSLKNLGFHRSSLGFTVELFRAGSTIFILVYGAMMVFTSGMLIGQVVACYYLLSQMTPALLRVGETSVTLREASIAWKRLADIWMIPTEKRRAGRPFKYFDQLKLIDGTFRWNNYHHLWGGIGISISRGMLVALTGPSGSGKTTLLQVLHRKYEPSGGMLLLDEQPARAYQLCEYRRRITLVPQQIHIFKTSLADNILLGRPSWYLNDLLKKFPFRDWLQRFNQGLATILGDGNRVLSGGEKQMIGLLRALYARPDILLIDESMNALDHETRERLIYSLKLFALNGGVLLCTHDRTVLSKMDQIYVLANGRIIRSSHPATRPYDHHEAEHRISENRRVL